MRKWGWGFPLSTKHLLICVVLSIAVVSPSTSRFHAQENQPLAKEIADLKTDILLLDKDIVVALENLHFSRPRVTVYLGLDAEQGNRLETVDLSLEESTLLHHVYAERENDALLHGGLQKLFGGTLTRKDQILTLAYTVLGPQGKRWQGGTSIQIQKRRLPRSLLFVIKGSGVSAPQVSTEIAEEEMSEILFRNGLFHYLMGDGLTASTLFRLSQKRSLPEKKQDEIKLWEGRALLSWGLDKKASWIFQDLIRQSSDSAVRSLALLQLAEIHYRGQSLDEALSFLDQITEPLPPLFHALAVYRKGHILYREKAFTEAMKVLDRVPKSSPYRPFALHVQAQDAVESKNLDRAETLWKQIASARHQGNPHLQKLAERARLNLGFLLLEQGRADEALKVLEALPPGQPSSDQVLFGKAWAHMKKNDAREAIKDLHTLVTSYPGSNYHLEALALLHRLYAHLPPHDNAIEGYMWLLTLLSREVRSGEWEKALQKNAPDLQDLDQLQGDMTSRLNEVTAVLAEESRLESLQKRLEKALQTTALLKERVLASETKALRERAASLRDGLEDLVAQAAMGLVKRAQESKGKEREESLHTILKEAALPILRNPERRSERKAMALHAVADFFLMGEERAFHQRVKEYRKTLSSSREGHAQQPLSFPTRDHAWSKDTYRALLQLYPERSANDRVLYQLARSSYEEGRLEEVILHLQDLIARYPESVYVQEASFRLGEAYSLQGEHPAAVDAYLRALENRKASFSQQALYKLGRSYFTLAEYGRTVETFLSLLDQKMQDEGLFYLSLWEKGKRREKAGGKIGEVIEMITSSIITLGDPRLLQDHLTGPGHKGYEHLLYTSLATAYLHKGKKDEALRTYRSFLNRYPLSEEAPWVQQAMITISDEEGQNEKALEESVRLADSYSLGSSWQLSNSYEDYARVRPFIKDAAYRLALHFHSQAQKSRKKEDAQQAFARLRRFLRDFPKDKESAQINILLADGLYESRLYEEAAEEYEKAAFYYPLGPSRSEAAYGYVLAHEKIMKAAGEVPSMTPQAWSFVEACSTFLQSFPGDQRAPDVLLKATQVMARTGFPEEARKLATATLAKVSSPSDKTLYLTQRLVAEGYFHTGDYPKAIEEYRKTLSLVPPSHAKDLPELHNLLAMALYKEAEGWREQGRPREAARLLAHIQEEFPSSEAAPAALFEAGMIFLEEDLSEAEKAFVKVVEGYPLFPSVSRALVQLASIYEKQEKVPEVVRTYERILSLAGDRKVASEALFMVGLLSERMGDQEKAYRSFLEFSARFPEERERALEALHEAAMLKEGKGEDEEADRLFHQILHLSKQEADSSSPRIRYLTGHSAFMLAENLSPRFNRVKIVAPLEVSLKKKKALLTETLERYGQAGRSAMSGIATAASFRVGQLLEKFRHDLLDSERPKGLTPQQSEQYTLLLEEQTYPLEEKAITAYESNVRRTQEFGLYDEWIRMSYERLADLLPARYQREERPPMGQGADQAVAHNTLGIIYRKGGEFLKAEREYLQAVSLRPDFPEPYLHLGILYELYLNRPQEALENYQHYLRIGKDREKEITVWVDILRRSLGHGGTQ